MDPCANSYRRFLEGDERAFEELMEGLFRNLVFFVNRYVEDLQAAEDIAIDSFSDLIVHKHRYNFKVTLKTYLFMLGRSRALDYLRRRKLIELVALSGTEGLEDEKSLEEIVLGNARKRAVHRALEQLAPAMRIAVHLVYFEELSYGEAARVMGKSRKQVDNLLYRAKKELRSLLGEDGEQLI